MKHIKFILLAVVLTTVGLPAMAQTCHWVFLTDKQGTTFDPYAYFDAKAIERYQQCGADLYDESNYPLNGSYVRQVNALATEGVGESRWFNAVAVMATPEQVAAIEELPFVLRVQPIEADMQLAQVSELSGEPGLMDYATVEGPLEAQLVRMGGKSFRDKGIDGKGIRIAVLDGGFPQVNTHYAFKHLRDNHQIVKTWNFPNNKENVYGWNSHGTMTLSCIAGRAGDKDLGLATGAEFLLARTEIESEPFKEEVWWEMAVEWADKNGAQIISSSLGYGKERHYTKDMDGTSYVAKAGNMAARKGILVVCSAGNEATTKEWKTLVTPSDADSVLCIGGIENSLTEYNHIEFSSYGPSADGRQKPNVCAFGYARTANTGDDGAFHYVHGTSFSCPLVAGFAACAMQAMPGKNTMEMFHMIEQSGDLYPYCDYSFGYGVPQADYFTGGRKSVEPTFRFEVEDTLVRVVPLHPVKHSHLFYSFRDPQDHILTYYGKTVVHYMDENDAATFTKRAIFNRTLTVHLAGYTDSLKLPKDDYIKYQGLGGFHCYPEISENAVTEKLTGRNGTPDISNWGSCATWRYNFFGSLGSPLRMEEAEMPSEFLSPSIGIGLRVLRAFGKVYCVGMTLEYNTTSYIFDKKSEVNPLEASLGTGVVQGSLNQLKEVKTRQFNQSEVILELFQRIRFMAVGLIGHGFHWDLGVYGSMGFNEYRLKGDAAKEFPATKIEIGYNDLDALSNYDLNYGVVTRLTYDFFGIYARYRLNGIGKEVEAGKVLLPRLTVGVLLQL